jgi:tetratricopeptide (TPR) repeat protein
MLKWIKRIFPGNYHFFFHGPFFAQDDEHEESEGFLRQESKREAAHDLLLSLFSVEAKSGWARWRRKRRAKRLHINMALLEASLSERSYYTVSDDDMLEFVSFSEAINLSKKIRVDDSPYVRALKAIVEKEHALAEKLMDETQDLLNGVQTESREFAQAKLFSLRIRNALNGGRGEDILPWCLKLEPIGVGEGPIFTILAFELQEAKLSQEAEILFTLSLKVHEEIYGKSDLMISEPLRHLAIYYMDESRFQEAESLMDRSRAIFEGNRGEMDCGLLEVFEILAELYSKTERQGKGVEMFEEAIALAEEILEHEELGTGGTRLNLATLYRKMGRDSEAITQFELALPIYKSKLGADHEFTRISVRSKRVRFPSPQRYLRGRSFLLRRFF